MAQEVVYDVDSYDVVTEAIDDLLNKYPGLDDEKIEFSKLDEDCGFGWFPAGAAIIKSERISVTDHVTQICELTFFIVYRAHSRSAEQKKEIKNLLDDIGRWLEQQTVAINDTEYCLSTYPTLSGEREIERISRKTAAYLDSAQEDGCEDWAISIAFRYKNEYDK